MFNVTIINIKVYNKISSKYNTCNNIAFYTY